MKKSALLRALFCYLLPLILPEQPIQRRPTDPILPRQLRLTLMPHNPIVVHRCDILDLDGLASLVLARALGDCNALALPLEQVGALELVYGTNNGQRQLAHRRACVNILVQTDQ